MARASKVTPEQWVELRRAWESDPRAGFTWLVSEIGVSISPQAVRKRSVAEGWAKVTEAVKVTPKVTGKPKEPREELSEELSSEEPKPKKSLITETVVENDELSAKEKVFVAEYLKDFNATQALIRTGHKGKNASQSAYQLLQKPSVQTAIRSAVSVRANKLGIDGDELMRIWAETINYDANELVQIRRIPCPYCYAENDQPQYTIKTYNAAKKFHDAKRKRRLAADPEDDIGEFPTMKEVSFIDPHKPANPECPICHGDGIEEYFPQDTRFLSEAGKRMYCGAAMVMGDIQYMIKSKEKAADNLARALGMFREKPEETTVIMVDKAESYRQYVEIMRQAKEKQIETYRRRGKTDYDVSDLEVIDG